MSTEEQREIWRKQKAANRKKNPERSKQINRIEDIGRAGKQTAKGILYRTDHPEKQLEYDERRKQKINNRGLYADEIERRRNPIIIYSDESVVIAADFHIPFHDTHLLQKLCDKGEEMNKPKLIVPGDFWDFENYSHYCKEIGVMEPFETEVEHVATVTKRLRKCFSMIYFTMGNHEKRIIDFNGGRMTMEKLFKWLDVSSGYEVTMDTFLNLIQQGQLWLIGHPSAYSQTPLQVASRLATKHHCNVAVGHSHLMATGFDPSGKFRICDLGGMYHQPSLDYQRKLTRHPMNKSGFFILENNTLTAIEPDPIEVILP